MTSSLRLELSSSLPLKPQLTQFKRCKYGIQFSCISFCQIKCLKLKKLNKKMMKVVSRVCVRVSHFEGPESVLMEGNK